MPSATSAATATCSSGPRRPVSGGCPHVRDRGQEAHGDRGVPGAERERGRGRAGSAMARGEVDDVGLADHPLRHGAGPVVTSRCVDSGGRQRADRVRDRRRGPDRRRQLGDRVDRRHERGAVEQTRDQRPARGPAGRARRAGSTTRTACTPWAVIAWATCVSDASPGTATTPGRMMLRTGRRRERGPAMSRSPRPRAAQRWPCVVRS